jgi:tetratricopeptide (TPR) repeat protein
MMLRSKISCFLAYLSVTGFMACRTVAPKKGAESLRDSQSLPGPGQDVPKDNDEDSGADVLGDAAAMWSPANRRANAMYQYLVAQNKFLRGDSAAAESHFEMSYNLDPNAFTGSQLVRTKIIADPKSDEGLTEARRMSLLYPLDANLRLLFGQALIFKQDYRESELQLRSAIELDPKLEDAYNSLIKCLQISGQTKSAIDVAYRMTKNIPHSSQSWSLLSRLLVGAKRVKEAVDPARKAWELQENNPELALIYALTLDLNNRGKEAVKLYEQLYRFNPGNTDLVQRMVALYKELGNLSNALSLIDDMIENSSDEVPGLKMQKVIILWEMQRFDEAMKVILALERELPDSDRVSFMAGIALAKANRRKEASGRFERIQNESPLKSDAMKQQAVMLKEDGDLNGAVALLRVLSSRKDSDVSVYLLWGELLADENRFTEALAAIDSGLIRFPGDIKLLFSKGAYFERTGDKRSAESVFRELVTRDPNNAAALNFLGYMFAEQGINLDEAEELIQRALKIQPDNGGYLDSLGWVYFQKKQYQRALEILERAVILEKDEGVIWEHIGDALIALGDKQKALVKYREALRLKNDPRDEARIKNKYESLSKELSGG